MREFRLHGFGRGAVSNDRPYRASARAIPGLTQRRPRLQIDTASQCTSPLPKRKTQAPHCGPRVVGREPKRISAPVRRQIGLSAMRRQRSDDDRPDTRVSLSSYRNLRGAADADLAGVFDERDILDRQRIKERFNRGERCNLVCRVDDRECRDGLIQIKMLGLFTAD